MLEERRGLPAARHGGETRGGEAPEVGQSAMPNACCREARGRGLRQCKMLHLTHASVKHVAEKLLRWGRDVQPK